MHGPAPLCSAAVADVRAVRHVLHRDYETRSRISLKLVGTPNTQPISTEILCAAYAVDDDPVQLWLPGDPIPAEFIEAAHDPSWAVAAHGDHFETAIEQHVLAPRLVSARSARAPPLHDGDSVSGWIAGTARHGRAQRLN